MKRFVVIALIVLISILPIVVDCAKKSKKNSANTQDDPIEKLQQMISSGKVHGQKLAALYYQLGMQLQQGWFTKKIGTLGLTNAINAFEDAIENNVDRSAVLDVQSYVNEGLCYKLMSQGEKSLNAYEKALSYPLLPTDQALIYYNQADTYLMLGNVSQAVSLYQKSISLTPCKTERYFGFISALKEDKTFTNYDWQRIFQQLHNTEQHCINQYDKNFAIPKRTNSKPKQNIFKSLEEDDENEDYGDEEDEENDRLFDDTPETSYFFMSDEGYLSHNHNDFYFACYMVADKLNIPALSWEALMKSKQLTLDHMKYEPTRAPFDGKLAIEQKDNVLKIFTKEFLQTFPNIQKKASKVPVFIVGMMRSGSTLLETMLDTHPAIIGMGEDSVFNGNLTYLRDSLVSISTQTKNPVQQQLVLRDLLLAYGKETVKKMKVLAWQQHEQFYSTQNPMTNTDNNNNNQTATNSTSAKEYKNIKKVVDKMLFNYRNIGFLHMVYPEAVIINMLRDPLDTLFSCFRYKFNDQGLEWTLLEEALVLQYVLYLQYIQHFRTILPDRVIDIRYEQLVYEPETIIPQVFAKLQLSYNLSDILQFHQHKRVVQTNSQSQIRSSLYRHSIGSWRKYAPHLQRIKALFQKHVPILRRMGALPFAEYLNWEMKEDFPYDTVYEKHRVIDSTTASSADGTEKVDSVAGNTGGNSGGSTEATTRSAAPVGKGNTQPSSLPGPYATASATAASFGRKKNIPSSPTPSPATTTTAATAAFIPQRPQVEL